MDTRYCRGMTKTYTTTITATTTPTDGQPAWLVECTCATHPKGMTKAIVRSGGAKPSRAVVHGNVTLAHSPAGALAARMARPNVWKA